MLGLLRERRTLVPGHASSVRPATHWVLDVPEGLASPRALPPPATTKILVTLRNGQAVHTEPVPDDALVTSIGQIRDLLAKRGYLVIDRQELIATHRPCGYLQAAMEGVADAWNQMAETTGVDGVRVEVMS